MKAAHLIPPGCDDLKIEMLGDRALLLTLGEGISGPLNDQVHRLAACLRHAALPSVRDLVPAYATLAVHYDPTCPSLGGMAPHQALEQELQRLWQACEKEALPTPRHLEIPVCYGGEFGPDLAAVAAHCGFSATEVITRHQAPDYRVYMLGFTPGFPYLGGLDPALATPRRATPRAKVAAGSVGIAGSQTGIYSLETPGGWQIIGRTPRQLFAPTESEPCLLRPGDRLTFTAIDAAEFWHQAGTPS